MDSKIDIRLNSRDLIGVAAVWKSPELLKIILIPVIAIWLGSSLIAYVQGNVSRMNAKSEAYSTYVRKCTSMYFQKYGEPDTQAILFCKRWANTKVRMYDNI